MKRLIALLVLAAAAGAAACRHGPSAPLTGAPAPRVAVETFLNAVRAQDLQAMSVAWGTKDGPARDRISRDQLEKRELIMMCYLKHDRYRLLGESPREEGRRVIRVELTRGTLTRSTNFVTVQGPSDRWYVETADLAPLQELCASGGSAGGG